MQHNVKMYTPSLGTKDKSVIRIIKGYLPELSNSLGNRLFGNVVQIIHPEGKNAEVSVVCSFETYGEPAGGLYIPFVKLGLSLNGQKHLYTFMGEDRQTSSDIDFSQILPEGKEFVETALEAIKQSEQIEQKEYANNKTTQSTQAPSAFEIKAERYDSPITKPQQEKTSEMPQKVGLISRLRQILRG